MGSSFEYLKVWQKSSDFIIEIYDILLQYPDYERYAMVSQIRRATNSVCANIAEGTGRRTKKDFINFLYVARGSLEEVRSFLLISERLGYINKEELNKLKVNSETISKMLNGLIKSLYNEIV